MISLQINIDGNNKIELVKAIQNGTLDITTYFKNNVDKNNNVNVESIIQKASNIDLYPINRKYQPKTRQELRTLLKGLIVAYGPNVNLNNIDTSLITDMRELFSPYENIGSPQYTIVRGIFENFNGDISRWDVSNVKDMSHMFESAEVFNGDISNWDVSNVKDMSHMFESARSFNGDISNWNVSNVETLDSMFESAKAFNGDLSKWNTSKVKNIKGMFEGSAFNNNSINNWNTSNIENFRSVFSSTKFNGKLDNWDTSKAVDMSALFQSSSFNNDSIKNWNMRNVKNVNCMFAWTSFDKDLSNWRLDSVEHCDSMVMRSQGVKEYPAHYMDHWMDNRIDYLSTLSREEKREFKEIGVCWRDPKNKPLWFKYLSTPRKKNKVIEDRVAESIINKYKERQKFKEDLKNILK